MPPIEETLAVLRPAFERAVLLEAIYPNRMDENAAARRAADALDALARALSGERLVPGRPASEGQQSSTPRG